VSQDSAIRRVAAIDCGTNSIRLLVADVDPVRRTLTDLDRRLEIVRLGQGVDKTGRLAPEALERTLTALAEYARIVKARGVSQVRMVATSATRDASNAADFTRGVLEVLGQAPEVLTGDEEAALSFAGATAEFSAGGMGRRAGQEPPASPYLVLDIGGGSTEFVLGDTGTPGGTGTPGAGAHEVAAISMNIGCVRMTERHLHSDPPTPPQIAAATADIDGALEQAAMAVDIEKARTLVGLAGSVTTVAAIVLELPGYDAMRIHHAKLTAPQVHAVTSRLLAQTRAERAAIPSMHPGRVDVIGAGSLVLDRVMRRFGFTEVVVSEHDILDGIAWSMIPSGNQPSATSPA
jgi:exopolyphosphatase/guanosine-5'-triphosphate,3'-diphosphate pyrophosphatase